MGHTNEDLFLVRSCESICFSCVSRKKRNKAYGFRMTWARVHDRILGWTIPLRKRFLDKQLCDKSKKERNNSRLSGWIFCSRLDTRTSWSAQTSNESITEGSRENKRIRESPCVCLWKVRVQARERSRLNVFNSQQQAKVKHQRSTGISTIIIIIQREIENARWKNQWEYGNEVMNRDRKACLLSRPMKETPSLWRDARRPFHPNSKTQFRENCRCFPGLAYVPYGFLFFFKRWLYAVGVDIYKGNVL